MNDRELLQLERKIRKFETLRDKQVAVIEERRRAAKAAELLVDNAWKIGTPIFQHLYDMQQEKIKELRERRMFK